MSESTYTLFQRGRRHLRAGMAAQATVSLEKAKRREPDKASIVRRSGSRTSGSGAGARPRRSSARCWSFRRTTTTRTTRSAAASRSRDATLEANAHYKLASSLRPGSDQYRARIRELD